MLNACAARFDVTENLKNFANFLGTKQVLTKKYYPQQSGVPSHRTHCTHQARAFNIVSGTQSSNESFV